MKNKGSKPKARSASSSVDRENPKKPKIISKFDGDNDDNEKEMSMDIEDNSDHDSDARSDSSNESNLSENESDYSSDSSANTVESSASDNDQSNDEDVSDSENGDANEGIRAPEDEMQIEGLMQFPDFSAEAQENQNTSIPAGALNRIGLPKWLLNPRNISSEVRVKVDDPSLSLSTKIIERCRHEGIDSLFAVQSAVIPTLREAQSLSRLRHHVRDLCVSAPTGSGKTLAYVLPITEKLASRTVVRLRALVVVPTRDLVAQVKETFDKMAKGTDLRIGAVTGAISLAKEQRNIVGNLDTAVKGGSSKVDILICTPGRLVDHLNMTPNFTLQHLEFWVMDEADRLLNQSYHGWLNQVHKATNNVQSISKTMEATLDPLTKLPIPDAMTFYNAEDTYDILSRPPQRIQKLLFSATLTRDPAKIASLRLQRPVYISVESPLKTQTTDSGEITSDVRYSMPSGLKSLEAAHRLYQVVELFDQHYRKISSKPSSADSDTLVVAEFSSDLQPQKRHMILNKFREGKIRLLICSDLIARGLDLDCVQAVISYDAPMHMDKYVHRVGRTARAGRDGVAYTLVEKQEARFFKQMMREHSHYQSLARFNIKSSTLDEIREPYEASTNKISNTKRYMAMSNMEDLYSANKDA
ncbi:ATP-dependent RNA helicase dbp6 [Mycoemilia scoparia]|uniref:ATP-dependent RNA helicase n=1 Tax=Mycoemilia scoparia TaxID=417184 RepID=A0A9W8AAA3_9FUNG|nr:ATP-dependent RNA helicase dbp6 [Mycoemilia scoparia]